MQSVKFIIAFMIGAIFSLESLAQVHYFEDGRPWTNKTNGGPDREVDGWYYNLGITGLRAELSAERPKHLLIRHVFAGSPADQLI